MYQKYQTEALVLGNRASGEADKSIALYTEDFGLVRARARGVRKESSKMRYSLQNYSYAQVGLIRGARDWRIAGASVIAGIDGASARIAAFARLSKLALRLIAGEEPNPYLFGALRDAHGTLFQDTGTAEKIAAIELLCAARILYALGYISSEALETALFTHTMYAEPHLVEAETLQKKLLSSVNQAMAETQL